MNPAPRLVKPAVEMNGGLSYFLKFITFIGLEVAKDAIVAVSTVGLGPVGTMVSEALGDMAVGIIEDLIFGNNPLDASNLVINFGFPALKMLRKWTTIKRFNRAYLRNIGGAVTKKEQKELYKLHNELSLMKFGELNDANASNYAQIMEKYKRSGLFERLRVNIDDFADEIEANKTRAQEFMEHFHSTLKGVKYINRFLSFNKFDYAARFLTARLTRNLKTRINRHIKNWYKRFGHTLTKVNAFLYKTIIPLRHTGKVWILGIRVFQVQRLNLLFNIQFVFHPKRTNNKQPVWVYNKKIEDIKNILAQESAGQYYIRNISWGWEIGKIIRQSGALKAGFYATSLLPYVSASLAMVLATYRTIHQLIINVWKWEEKGVTVNEAVKVGKGVGMGLIQGISGVTFAKAVVNTIGTQNDVYFKRYAMARIKRSVNLAKRSHVRNTIKELSYHVGKRKQ